jgi:hypothetical protein
MINPADMSSEEEKMMEHQLSADAAPFHPYTFCDPVSATIYNDGIPSMVMSSSHALSDILHGIQDEALDQEFPPDATEAAEIEAVEIFVEMMAQLSMLEEIEEQSRVDFHHIKKRWESRRQDGLKSRPRVARHMFDRVDHKSQTNQFSSQCRVLVPVSHHQYQREKMAHHEATRRVARNRMPAVPATLRPTIQQPRKQS